MIPVASWRRLAHHLTYSFTYGYPATAQRSTALTYLMAQNYSYTYYRYAVKSAIKRSLAPVSSMDTDMHH